MGLVVGLSMTDVKTFLAHGRLYICIGMSQPSAVVMSSLHKETCSRLLHNTYPSVDGPGYVMREYEVTGLRAVGAMLEGSGFQAMESFKSLIYQRMVDTPLTLEHITVSWARVGRDLSQE